MSMKIQFSGNAVAAATLAVAITVAPFASAARADELVLSTADVQARTGKSIADWGAQWWQWAFNNPDVLVDKTGTSGPLGDVTANVFFIEASGGHPVNLKYVVPAGKYLLVPVMTYIWTFFDPCAEPVCAAHIVNDNVLAGVTDVYMTVDGVPIADLTSHLVTVSGGTVPFQVDAGPIGPDGYGGILDAYQGGYWVMLSALSPGVHRISFGATVPLIDAITGERVGGTLDLTTKLRLDVVNVQ